MQTMDEVNEHCRSVAQGIADSCRKMNKKGVMIMNLRTILKLCAIGAVACMSACSPKCRSTNNNDTIVESNYKLPPPENNLISFLVENVGDFCENGAQILHDDNFKYILGGRNSRRVIRRNQKATLYDLCNFESAVCWNVYLKDKMESETKITVEDAELLKFCIAANLDMMDAVVYATLSDMFGSFLDYYIPWRAISGTDAVSKLKEQFIDGNEGVRRDIRNWASIYRYIHPLCVRKVFSDVIDMTGNADIYRSGNEIESDFVRWLNKRMPSVANWGEKNKVMLESMEMSNPGKEVRNLWTHVHESTKRYPARIAEIRKSITGMRARGITDSTTIRLLDDMERETLNCGETFDCIIYDLPFCILTYRTLGRLKDCINRSGINNKRKMKVITSDYTYAICGTEMLKGLRSRYSASCYTEVIKFLKSKMWEREFEDFVNETKLYNITLQSGKDGAQDNKLDAL